MLIHQHFVIKFGSDARCVFFKQTSVPRRRGRKRKMMKRVVFLILSIVWMIGIFLFSAQPADESTETSLYVGEAVCSIFVPGYRSMPEDEQTALAERIDHPVRKTAHATEYAVLAVFWYQALPGIRDRRKYRFRASLLICAAYAATDEFHQLFVPGRAGRVTDVLIDSAGAAAGLLIVFMIVKTREKRT